MAQINQAGLTVVLDRPSSAGATSPIGLVPVCERPLARDKHRRQAMTLQKRRGGGIERPVRRAQRRRSCRPRPVADRAQQVIGDAPAPMVGMHHDLVEGREAGPPLVGGLVAGTGWLALPVLIVLFTVTFAILATAAERAA